MSTKKHNDTDLNSLREAWKSQQFHAPDRTSDIWRANRAGAFSQQLSARFRTVTAGCLLMAVLIWGFNAVLNLPLWLMICLTAFFIIMSGVQGSMWMRLRRLNFGRMNLCEAIDAVVGLRRGMIVRIAIGVCLGLPLIVTMLHYFLDDDPGVFGGGIAGALIGGLIGAKMCRRNFWFIKKMRQTLADAESEHSDPDECFMDE